MRIGNAIYLDHQATTPVDSRVFEAMAPYFGDIFGNPHSADHSIGWTSAKAVEDAANRVARLVGGDEDEIVFTSGATEANNLAILGLGRRAIGSPRRRILCSAIEHKCVLAAARALRDLHGFELELLPVDDQGYVKLDDLARRLREDVLLVSVMLVNNEIGTIQPIAEIASLAAKVGAVVHCDAAQGPCAVDLTSLGTTIDMISLSAHKMYGPKGIGALFVRRKLQHELEPIIYGGGQQRNLRSGTLPTALCVGMAEAASIVTGDRAATEREYVRQVRDKFVDATSSLPWKVTVNGPALASRHPGNANLLFEGFSAHDILGTLQPALAASTGAACTSGIPEPSHVLRAIGRSDEGATASIRFSFGRQTTLRDAEEAVQLISDALQKLSDADLRKTA